ncbi:hypothetical protein ACQPXH_00695 [Nocardia sp. CA-135953]
MGAPDSRAQTLDDDPALDRIVALVAERLDTDAVAAAKCRHLVSPEVNVL